MIRLLAGNCIPILDCSNDDGKTVAENVSDERVMGAVWALCEFCLLVSQQNYSDLSLKELEDAFKQCYQRKGISPEQKMSNSAKATVHDLLPRESQQLCEQQIHKICAAMEVPVYGAENISTAKHRQIKVHLIRARQAATTWSEVDRQKVIERLEHKIHQTTPAKCMLLHKLFQRHDRQYLLEVGTKSTTPKCEFSKELTLMKADTEEEACGVANMTGNKQLQFGNFLSDAETKATPWSLADPQWVTNQLERVIYDITANEQKVFKKEFSIRVIEFIACWEKIAIYALRKTIKQHIRNLTYSKMYLVSHISESIQ